MRKIQATTYEYAFSAHEARSIYHCLQYCLHRIRKHGKQTSVQAKDKDISALLMEMHEFAARGR